MLSGETGAIYDFQKQAAIQNQYWPSYGGRFLPFVYPAPYAFLFLPLAKLTPDNAKIVYTLIQVLLVACAGLVLRKNFAINLSASGTVLLFVLFAPTLLGIAACQTVGLLLLIVALYLSLRTRSPFVAGLIAGCLFFKPHYLLFILAFEFRHRNWKFLGGALSSLLALCLNWGRVFGWSSISDWVHAISSYRIENAVLNSSHALSFAEVSSSLSPHSYPMVSTLLLIVGLLIVVTSPRIKVENLFLLVLFFSPHALVYDAVLLLPLILKRRPGDLLLIFALAGLFTAWLPPGLLLLSGL